MTERSNADPVPSRTMSLPQFMYEDYHGRKLKHASRPPFTCGATGRSYSAVEVAQRVDYLSRSLAAAVGFDTEEGTEWERVVGIFSYNSVSATSQPLGQASLLTAIRSTTSPLPTPCTASRASQRRQMQPTPPRNFSITSKHPGQEPYSSVSLSSKRPSRRRDRWVSPMKTFSSFLSLISHTTLASNPSTT